MKLRWTAKILLFFTAFGVFLGAASYIKAQTCSSVSECQSLIDQYNQKITELQGQANTLNNQIAQFNAQITLTSLKITQTQEQIKLLGGRIDQLETSLGSLSDAFSERAVQTYKMARSNEPVFLLLNSKNLNEIISSFYYLAKIEQADQALMVRLQKAQNNYKDQKVQQEELAKQLKDQQRLLNTQKAAKANLLAVTKNDEAKYQSLLSQAVAQRNAFQNFVLSQGGASILNNQTVCGGWGQSGCYYNQRDARWGNMSLGASGLSVAGYGCLVSSSAMIATFYGKNINPGDIAGNSSVFFGNTAYLLYNQPGINGIVVNGVTIDRTSIGVSTANIDSELAAGRPVIVGLYSGPAHFIVLKSGSNGNYIMNDPFMENGHDVSFSSKYSVGIITDVEKVTVQ